MNHFVLRPIVTFASEWILPISLSPFLQKCSLIALVLLVFLISSSRVPLAYNIRNLTLRWKTTIMTALAFTAVIGLLTIMLAFVESMARLIEGSGRPGNVILLSQGTTDEVFSTLGYADAGDIENQPGIARTNDKPLCSRETYLIVNQPVRIIRPGRPQRRFQQLRGIEDPVISGKVHGLELYAGGNWFSDAGVEELPPDPSTGSTDIPAIQVVIGEGLAKELGSDRSNAEINAARNPDRLDVGDSFPLGSRIAIVKGIMKSAGTTYGSEIWAKRSVVAPLFGKNAYTSIVLQADTERESDRQVSDSPQVRQETQAGAASKLADFFNNEYAKTPLQAQVETDYYKNLSDTNAQFLYAITFVAAVMAIGGAFGVMNTMFAAVSQRIKDIGVLRLIGFPRRQILVSFLLESLVLAFAGGCLGCFLGSFANGWTANSIVSGQAGGKLIILKLIIGPDIIAIGLLLSLAMGGIGGLIPALSAMRLRALEALR